METKKHCVFNKTTERFLSAGVTSLSSKNEPLEALKMMVDAEDLNVESGLWLTPFRGIPVARIFSPVDVVYLDEGYQVLHAEELFPGIPMTPYEGKAASALVLPLRTVFASSTSPGDQLIICFAEELVKQLARVSTSVPAPVAPRAETPARKTRGRAAAPSVASIRPTPQRSAARSASGSAPKESSPPESPRGKEDSGPRVSATRTVPQEFPARPPVQKVNPEIQPREIDTVISQVLRWAEKTERPLTPASASTPPLPVEKAAEPPPESSNQSVAVAPTAPVAAQATLGQESVIEEPDEVWDEQDASVISQSVRWVEDTKPKPAPEPLAAAPAPAAPSPESGIKWPRSTNIPASTVPGGRPASPQAATPPLKADKKAESMDEKKDPLKVRLQRLAEQIEQPLRTAPVPQAPARASQSGDSHSQKIAEDQASIPKLPVTGAQPRQASVPKLGQKGKAAPRAKQKDSLQNRFMKWLYPAPAAGPADRRRSSRHRARGLVAYYYTGGAPKPHRIGDISTTGFYLLTEERWLPDTIIRMTLQRAGTEGDAPEDAISVVSKIVRCGMDGVGSEFILADTAGTKHGNPMPGATSSREDLVRFLSS